MSSLPTKNIVGTSRSWLSPVKILKVTTNFALNKMTTWNPSRTFPPSPSSSATPSTPKTNTTSKTEDPGLNHRSRKTDSIQTNNKRSKDTWTFRSNHFLKAVTSLRLFRTTPATIKEKLLCSRRLSPKKNFRSNHFRAR